MEEERLYDLYAIEEDIKILTEEYSTHKKEEAIEHLIEAYRKSKEQNKELEKAIDRMTEFIYTKTDFTTSGNIKSIKEYFMEDK